MAVYPFAKFVRPGRLHEELRVALGDGVVTHVNTSAGPPPSGEVHTSRDLSPAEWSTGVSVIQAHDAQQPEGIGGEYKRLRALAAPLIGRTFQSLTLAELKVVLACVCVKLGFVGDGGILQLPESE